MGGWGCGWATRREESLSLTQKDPEPQGQERARSSSDTAGVREDAETPLELEQGCFCVGSFSRDSLRVKIQNQKT